MENKYAEDLDELIEFRSEEFIENRLSTFVIADTILWNRFNEDMFILPFDDKYRIETITDYFFLRTQKKQGTKIKRVFNPIAEGSL